MFPLLIEPEPCPGCGAEGRARPVDAFRTKQRVSAAPSLAVLGCERCGLLYTHPRPTPEELSHYYEDTGGWQARREAAPREKRDRSLERKRTYYRMGRDLLARFVPPPDQHRRVLDFGCGLGAWLDVLAEDGWETWGIEPGSADADEAAQRHNIVEAPPPEIPFDLVIVNHVLEHLRDPGRTLRTLAGATRPGAVIFVSVPSVDRLPEHGNWEYLISEYHICAYTRAALTTLLGLSGFRVVEGFDPGPWDTLVPKQRTRLKLLGERVPEPIQPSGNPLDPAIEAMLAYPPAAARTKRARKEAKRRRRERKEASRRRRYEKSRTA